MNVKNLLFVIALLLAIPFTISAQVTTSSLTGYVKANTGESLVGATVELVHVPTGTMYRTVSRKDGRYDLVNLIPGGPYSLTVSNVGYTPFSETSLMLPLGENTRVDADMNSTATDMAAVVVTASGSNATRRKTGAGTNISNQQIQAMPTLSRSLQDFTRLSPQANGNSFGGANNRFNNITIDGAVNNDVFGLAGSGTPGGQAGTTPISLDAIQEIQVVLAPFDITYGNFTGGGVNAVTRSGTNEFQGSVYYFMRNENTIGKDPLTNQKSTAFNDNQFGARIGGPIIKNKLFFFLNGEMARRSAPTILNANEPGALITEQEAIDLAENVRTRFGYEVGDYTPVDAETQSDKLFARIDWNINSKHRLTLRHNYIQAYDDNISRSANLFRFGNNTYRFNNEQHITVAELRSTFGSNVTNNFLIGNHRIRDFRSTYGDFFPSVEISHIGGTIQFGSDRSSTANELDQDIIEITNNLKIFKGKHTFTIGTHNEFFKFRNLFINNRNGRWRFNSLNDWYANAPRQFDVTYSADKDVNPLPAAEFEAAQLGFYVQDEIQFNKNFRLTVGLRADMPLFNTEPPYNRAVDSTFGGIYNTSNVPDKQILWSPRVGFNYDVEGNRKTIVRGGVGIFTGRVPFVWISNQFSNTGLMLKTTSQIDNTPTAPPYTVNNGNGFTPDVDPSTIGTATGSSFEVNLIDKDFKIPQVARFNLGIDRRFDGGVNLTIEAMYSKTLNNVLYQDVNLTAPVGVVNPIYNNGFDTRIAYASSSNARRINPNITNAILISNTDEGYTFNLGFTLNKTWKRVFGQVTYNFNNAQDINSGTSSTALSNWEYVQVVGNPNSPVLATSTHELRHRFTGMVSTNFEYGKHFKTTVALFYQGNSGKPFTYLVNGDLNSDGRFGNDLLYVPADPSQITFIDRLNSSGAVVQTAAEQSAQFFAYIENDKYLSTRKGKYAERNGAETPFQHVIDARITQDFFIMVKGKKHGLQLTFDVFNITNLLNKDWGRQYFVSNEAYTLLSAVTRGSGASQQTGFNYTERVPWSTSFGSRWQGQVGIRYSFN